MKKNIKFLLIALGLGFFALGAQASCDPCNDPNPPPECNDDDDNNNGDFMPEGVLVDDMPSSGFADEVALPVADSSVAK